MEIKWVYVGLISPTLIPPKQTNNLLGAPWAATWSSLYVSVGHHTLWSVFLLLVVLDSNQLRAPQVHTVLAGLPSWSLSNDCQLLDLNQWSPDLEPPTLQPRDRFLVSKVSILTLWLPSWTLDSPALKPLTQNSGHLLLDLNQWSPNSCTLGPCVLLLGQIQWFSLKLSMSLPVDLLPTELFLH